MNFFPDRLLRSRNASSGRRPLLLLLLLLCPLVQQQAAAQSTPPDFARQYADLRTNVIRTTDSARLHMLFDLDHEYGMWTYPEWGTWEGRYERNSEWTDNSIAGIERRKKEAEWSYEVLQSIDVEKLSREDKLNYQLYRKQAERGFEGQKFPYEVTPINQLGGIHQEVPTLFRQMPKRSVKDYEDILSRMRKLPGVIRNDIALMRKGLKLGVTPPRVTLREVPAQVKSLLTDDPTESPIYAPFQEMPGSIAEREKERLQDEAVQLYKDSVAPAFWELHRFLQQEYIPNARETVGMYTLPDGNSWYAYRVKGHTTTDLTPREIFDIGKREVATIRAKMQQVVQASGFDGTLSEFEEFLRTDPQFYYTDEEELLRGYRDICKRVDPELAKLFGTLPRMPYGVTPVPDFMAPSQTTAYYVSGSADAARPGYFYANTYNLSSRPKWEMEPLALHEAVPGHHLQISLAQELDNLPRWRRDAGYTAFVEGWGLYAESLGQEMGFYTTPYSKYGQLSYQIWRAIRLVVDVGIHELGWTREQAIEYFASNSGKPIHDIEVEIDRYIVWPGQALAYKIGERKIRELRSYAEKELGDDFDIRSFHDELLGDGALPLDVLETKMKAWVNEQKKSMTMKGSGGR